MVKVVVASFSQILHSLADATPPGLILSAASAGIGNGKYFPSYRAELVGTILMIMCTFSAGKWIGSESKSVAWFSHFVGVIAADYFGGGPHVNPAVSLSMWALGKIDYTEFYVKVAAQMGGGLISFPLFRVLSDTLEWPPLGGPEFSMDDDEEHPVEAFLSEYFATLLLLILIYTVNWECNFGKYHYWIKQSLTAIGIRYLIEVFPTAGPAMNPMLGTCWAVFGVGNKFEFPDHPSHYIVYWVAPFCAALLASFLYVLYAGGTIFNKPVPFGPIKKEEAGAAEPSAPSAEHAKKD